MLTAKNIFNKRRLHDTEACKMNFSRLPDCLKLQAYEVGVCLIENYQNLIARRNRSHVRTSFRFYCSPQRSMSSFPPSISDPVHGRWSYPKSLNAFQYLIVDNHLKISIYSITNIDPILAR